MLKCCAIVIVSVIYVGSLLLGKEKEKKVKVFSFFCIDKKI